MMDCISMVRFRKYPRQLLLARRNLARVPNETARYIHRSAGFALLMGELGITRIGAYTRMMDGHAETLKGMEQRGTIENRHISALVDAVNSASETNVFSLNLIRNSLTRFVHTDEEPVIRPRMPRRTRSQRPTVSGSAVPLALAGLHSIHAEEPAGWEADES